MTDAFEGNRDAPWDAMVIDLKDNVAVALRDVDGEARVRIGDAVQTLRVLERITMGHKLAVRSLGEGEPVIKYGECIGLTTTRVNVGELVHVHNLASRRARATTKT